MKEHDIVKTTKDINAVSNNVNITVHTGSEGTIVHSYGLVKDNANGNKISVFEVEFNNLVLTVSEKYLIKKD